VAGFDELVRSLTDVHDLASLATSLTEALLQVVPGVSASYNELHLPSGRAFARIAPPPRDDWWLRFQPVFEAHMHQNPLLAALQSQGSLPASTWDDVDLDGSFRATELFRRFYLPLGIESQLVAAATDADGTVVAVAVNRGREGFGAAERQTLDAALPLALLARRMVSIEAERRALRQVLEADGWQVQAVDGDAEPDPVVRRALAAAAPADGADPAATALVRVVDAAQGRQVVAVGRALPPHLVLVRDGMDLQEPPLRALGLTARQAEVARHLATGASNREIATALRISPATVKKHLEAIYAALGATHRGGAVAALAAAGAVARPGG
jgi:DNA-binding NarL/FixJ family response regulator